MRYKSVTYTCFVSVKQRLDDMIIIKPGRRMQKCGGSKKRKNGNESGNWIKLLKSSMNQQKKSL